MSNLNSNANEEVGNSRPPNLFKTAIKFLDIVTKYVAYLSAATLAFIVCLYCMEIVLRYFFLSPTVWSRDTVTYLLAGTIFMAAPDVARQNGHVAITILVEKCRPKLRKNLEMTLACVAGVVALGVCWVTFGATFKLFDSGILTLGTVPVPKWWISVFIPIGFLLIGLQFLSLAIDPSRREPQKADM
ncbi:MAG: TRAP transporter small permease [Alphaproteobacteria bacterium]|nr:TRAP transporter small permease [Alphaproteobacteria bacterium]